jgi:hypothetical protein
MKVFRSVVKLEFGGNGLEAENKQDYIEKLKDLFEQEFNINLADNEIFEIEEESR